MMRKQNKSLGFYLPNFFRLHISIDNSIKDFNKLSDLDFSVFFHEYVHFLQNITTLYGLENIHVTVEYLRYANNFIVKRSKQNFAIPIEPDPSNSDNVFLNRYLCQLTYGDVNEFNIKEISNYELTSFPIDILNSPIHQVEVADVKFVDINGEEKIFTFGACCIMESMAYLLEQLTCKKYKKSPDIPYQSAELIVKHIYPDFGENKLNILALCDISLGISNPAEYFVLTLEDWKKKGTIPTNPIILYDDFKNGAFSLNGYKKSNYNNHLQKFSNVAISQLKGYFNDSLFDNLKSWIEQVISVAVDYRLHKPSFIIDIAKGNIRENEIFKELFNKIGTPLLTNNKKEFRFYHPYAYKKQIDIGYFWAINQIRNVFSRGIRTCELYEFCNQYESNTQTDERCKNEPWTRCRDEKLCYFAILWRHWGLTDYKPIIKERKPSR